MTNDEGRQTMADGHSVRIRDHRWEKVEKHAWKLMQQAGTFVKPTDIVDACIWLHIEKITLEDIKNAKKTQKIDD
jgi:hypothetical protein